MSVDKYYQENGLKEVPLSLDNLEESAIIPTYDVDEEKRKRMEDAKKKDKEFMERLKNKMVYISIEPIQTYPDPTDLIINLALLHFLPIGTKLHFYGGKMHIQEKGYYQSASRTLFNGSKTEIALYPISIVYGFSYNNDSTMKLIHEYAIKGLKKLNDTYGNEDCIHHHVDKCTSFIEGHLNKTKVFMFTRETKMFTKNIQMMKIENKNKIFEKFNKLVLERDKEKERRLVYKIVRLLHMNSNTIYGLFITPLANVMYNTIEKVSDNLNKN